MVCACVPVPLSGVMCKAVVGFTEAFEPVAGGGAPSYSHSFIVLSSNYLREVLLVSYLFQEFSGFSLVN